MEINKNNYELFFIDYFDGKLRPEQAAELFLFLEENPGLKKQFDTYESVPILKYAEIVFPGKESLKKSIVTEENFNEYAVALIENELDETGKGELEKFLTIHPAFRRELDLFVKVKLKADAQVVYPAKEKLKHHPKVVRFTAYQWASIAAAACILLLAGIYYFNREVSKPQPITVENQDQNKNSSTEKEKIEQPVNQEKNGTGSQHKVNHGKENSNPVETADNRKPIQEKQKEKSIRLPGEKAKAAIDLAQSITAQLISSADEKQEPVYTPGNKINLEEMAVSGSQAKDDYKTPGQLLQQLADDKMESISRETNTNEMNEYVVQTPKKKFLDALSWVVNKVTFKKVKLETTYDPQGELMAYQLNVGKANLSKDLSK